MYQFTIHLPHDEVEREIQRRCSYRRWPSSLFGAAYQPGILHGGKLRKGFWLAGWKEGTFGTRFRYFAYHLIPQGNQTIIRGKFVYMLYYRMLPYLLCVGGLFVGMQHGRLLLSSPMDAVISLAIFCCPIPLFALINQVDKHIALSKRWETLALDYLTKLERTYSAEPSDADGKGEG